eukprot:scaffold2910_cov390-Prasinococcus_capsulatus_cf.AAC.37
MALRCGRQRAHGRVPCLGVESFSSDLDTDGRHMSLRWRREAGQEVSGYELVHLALLRAPACHMVHVGSLCGINRRVRAVVLGSVSRTPELLVRQKAPAIGTPRCAMIL